MNSGHDTLRVGSSDRRGRGQVTPCHAHDWHQLTLCITGIIRIDCGDTRVLLTPGDALWIPSGYPHEASSNVACHTRSISIATTVVTAHPAVPTEALGHTRYFRPRPLLLELIARRANPEPPPTDTRALIDSLILVECASTPTDHPAQTLPRHRVLRRLCERIMQNPRIDIPLPVLARAAGSSPSTINRLFLRETGTTFRAWRQQIILQRAVAMRQAGKPMDVIAHTLGYSSRNALSAMMTRRAMKPYRPST